MNGQSNYNIHVGTTANLSALQRATVGLNQLGAAVTNANLGSQFSQGVLGGLNVPLSFGAAIAAIFGLVREMIAFAGATKDASEQLDTAIGEVVALDQVARAGGLSLGDFAAALGQLGVQRRSAAEGNDELVEKFKRFGVTLDDLQNPSLRNIDLMRKMSRAMGELSAADRTSLRDLLGRRGDRLASALSDLEGIKPDANLEEAIRLVDEYGKAWETVWHGVRNGAAVAFAGINAAVHDLMVHLRQGEAPPVNDEEYSAERHARATRLGLTREQMDPAARQYDDFVRYQQEQDRARQHAEGEAFRFDVAADDAAQRLRDAAQQFANEEARRQATPENQWSQRDRQDFANARARMLSERQEEEAARLAANTLRGQAQAAGRSSRTGFDDWRRQADQGQMFENKKAQAAELENAKKLEALQLSLLSTEQQRAYLLEQRAKLMAEIAGMAAGEAKQKKLAEVLDLEAKLAGLNKPGQQFKTPADQFQKMGALGGPIDIGSIRDPLAVSNELARARLQELGKHSAKLDEANRRFAAFSGVQ